MIFTDDRHAPPKRPPRPRPRPRRPLRAGEPHERPAAVRAADRPADGHPRHHGREHCAAERRRRPASDRLEHQLDDHELLADLRKPAPVRRPCRRPDRSTPDLPRRPRHLHYVLARLGAGRYGRCTLRRSGRSRARRGNALPPRSRSSCPLIKAAIGPRRSPPGAQSGGAGGGDRGARRRRPHRSSADWRMIFFVNLPVAAALAISAVKIIPADTQKPRWRGLDLAERYSQRRASAQSSSRSPRREPSAGPPREPL